MSFILDALRKAERDRNLGHAPRIEDVALAQDRSAPADGAGSRRWLRIIGLLLLLVIASLLVILILQKPKTAAVAQEPAGVVNATLRGPARISATTATPTPVPANQPEDAGPPALDADEDLSSLDDLSKTPHTKTASATPPDGVNVIREQDFVARPATADSNSDVDPIVVPQPVTSSASPRTSAPQPQRLSNLTDPSSNPSATPLSEMPPAYRADFPALTVEVHVWDSDPAKRFVLVNGHHYNEGDTLAQGPRLAEIAQDGLVLEYHGSRVLYSLQ
jgi:general secretion pathway protein B